MKISPDNKALHYTGRIDWEERGAPLFIYAGSSVEFGFTGTALSLELRNYPMGIGGYLGYVLDGIQGCIPLSDRGGEDVFVDELVTIGENLTEGKHKVQIFKRNSCQHYFAIKGIVLDENAQLFHTFTEKKLRIDVYGDSVSAGEVVEAVYYTGHSDPENHKNRFDNSYFSYPQVAGRKLSAEVYDNSQGGISLFDKTGWYMGVNEYVGMETVYDKLSYVPYSFKGYTDWDFNRFTPDYIVIAIGQNDANPDPECLFNSEYREKWINGYIGLIRKLQKAYNNTPQFICTMTVLFHEKCWDLAIEEAVERTKDPKVHCFFFRRNGIATPGHPRISEQEEMGQELADYITMLEKNNE